MRSAKVSKRLLSECLYLLEVADIGPHANRLGSQALDFFHGGLQDIRLNIRQDDAHALAR
jgi:hypothetical protein